MVRHLSSRPHGPGRQRGGLGSFGVSSMLLLGIAAAQIGCDNNAEFTPLVLTFKEVQIVSTTPATKTGSDWAPLCDLETDATGDQVTPDGVLLNTVFVSNTRNDGSSSYDKDQSLRPGDRVNFRNIVNSHTATRIGNTDIDLADPGLYIPEITCLEPVNPFPDGEHPTVPANDSENDDFRCIDKSGCTPSCEDLGTAAPGEEGAPCGADGCGGHCGLPDDRPGATGCAAGFACVGRVCAACTDISIDPNTGQPYASRCEELGRECGWDGCGGFCGTGTTPESALIGGCSHSGTGRCTGDTSVRCYVDSTFTHDACAGLGTCSGTCQLNDTILCSDDSQCNGACRSADIILKSCSAAGQCEGTKDKPCIPDCEGKVCGDDGCGGECGNTCIAGETCTQQDNCEGTRIGQVTLGRVDYKPFSEDRDDAHNVLVLLDRSGSLSGLVESGTYKEANEPAIPAGNFSQYGSDQYRYTDVAVTQFIKRLNDRDNVGVIAFGEGIKGAGGGLATDSMFAPCQNPDAADATTVEAVLDECFAGFGASGENNWIRPDCSSGLLCTSHQCQRAGSCSTNGQACTSDDDCTRCTNGTCQHNAELTCAVDSDCGTCNGVPDPYDSGQSWGCGGLQGNLEAGTGRSNLWSAVDKAYAYFSGEYHDNDNKGPKSLRGTGQSKHIVVVTDGPDTCDSGSEAFASCQSAPCGTANLDDVLARIQADMDDPTKNPIPIHFVQFESLGYRDRDPRQVKVSCMTGGHYQFINSEDLSKTNLASFEQALDQALLNVRYSLMGYWQLAHQVTSLKSNSPTVSGGTPPGSLYGFSGVLTVLEKSNLISQKAQQRTIVQAYGIGLGQGAYESKRWDRRPSFGKPCLQASDCSLQGGGALADETDCHIVCSPETNMCPNKAAGLPARNLAVCADDVGATGLCCDGGCNTNMQCITCQN